MQTSMIPGNHPLMGRKYILKRKLLKLIGSQFDIYDEGGVQVFQANQKGFKMREDIRIMGGPGFQQEVVGIFARQVFDFSASYDIVDSTTGQRIAVFQRKGLHSMARDEWVVKDANEVPFGTMIEDSMALALVRRFLSNLVPQNYDFLVGQELFIDLKQNFNPFTYHLNIDFFVPPERFDRRIGLAGAVLMAAIEGRQG